MAELYTGSKLDDRRLALKRWSTLLNDRQNGWDGHWKSLSENLLPRQSRFFTDRRNRGGDRNQSIIDSAGTQALRTLSAGMMAGMTSPARPWFRLTVPDADLADYHDVKVWLDKVAKLMQRIFRKSNTYNTLHSIYRELGGFGTGFSVVQPNFERVIHHNAMTVGEYALGVNNEGFVDKSGREFKLTVEQAAQWFGLENLSASSRDSYDRSDYNKEITVVHLIEPNPGRDPKLRDYRNMAFKSCYWDKSENDPAARAGLLKEGGYRYFPGLAPRWDILFGDTYGSSPGMDALGDLLELQHNQFRKAKGIDYQTDPPIQVPTQLRHGDADFLPGGVTYYDGNNPHGGIRTAFDVKFDLNYLLENIRDVRQRINSAFYADLFLMIADADKRMTATEVAERHEEKLLLLGPVLERLHNELLDPLIEMTFGMMLTAGIVPPPPTELHNVELQVEFVSMLAQAQRAVSVNSTDRLIGHIGVLVQGGKQDAWDKFDADKSIERYADQLGVDPDLIVADDQVGIIRSQRAQAQAAAAQAESAKTMSEAGRNAAQIPTGAAPQDNAANDIINLFSGYQSPAATELG